MDLAYPFGSYDARVIAAAKVAGYRSARSVEEGYNAEPDLEPFDIRGQNILRTTTAPLVSAALALPIAMPVPREYAAPFDAKSPSTYDRHVYLLQGRHEARGRAQPARERFAELRAPRKQLITIDHAGHRPLFERPARFHEAMTETVLAQTAGTRR